MKSIVLELQAEAMNSTSSVSDLLRKALVVARKLGIKDFYELLNHEMNGYPVDKDVPAYRYARGEVKAWNPYNGWIPIMLPDDETAEKLIVQRVHQAIGELETLVSGKKSGTLTMSFPSNIKHWLMKGMDLPLEPKLHISKNQIHSILETVRNSILDWSLELEEKGILGNNMSFSAKEKQQAESITYNIQSVNGVVGGNVVGDTVQIGNYNNIHQQLKELGVSQDKRNELETIMDEIPKADPVKKKTLIKKGLEWVKNNQSILGTAGGLIKTWLDNQ